MKTTEQVLIEARAKISSPAHWTQGAFARDVFGEPVRAYSTRACKFCALGAVNVVTPGDDDAKARFGARVLLGDLTLDTAHVGVLEFNDGVTYAEVLALFDRAIERARQEQEAKAA
jgi:hypothetical protein